MDVSIKQVKHELIILRKISLKNSKKNHLSPPSSLSILEAVRSKLLIKIQRQHRSPVVQQINDLDFSYMEELERKKMFMMIRLGHIKDPTRLLPIHNYEKIPVLPKQKIKNNNQTPSPKISPQKFTSYNLHDISLPTLSTKLLEDLQQMNRVPNKTKQKLNQKQKGLNVINKRILNKFTFE